MAYKRVKSLSDEWLLIYFLSANQWFPQWLIVLNKDIGVLNTEGLEISVKLHRIKQEYLVLMIFKDKKYTFDIIVI